MTLELGKTEPSKLEIPPMIPESPWDDEVAVDEGESEEEDDDGERVGEAAKSLEVEDGAED